MKALWTILLSIVWSQWSYGQNTQRLVTQLFAPKHISTLAINLPEQQVRIVPVKGSRITLETTIAAKLENPKLLKYLIGKRRYHSSLKEVNTSKQEFELVAPLRTPVLIQGKEMYETVEYVLYLPESIDYKFNEDLSLSALN